MLNICGCGLNSLAASGFLIYLCSVYDFEVEEESMVINLAMLDSLEGNTTWVSVVCVCVCVFFFFFFCDFGCCLVDFPFILIKYNQGVLVNCCICRLFISLIYFLL
ncbi:hypothetical protein ACOSQ3_021654 [Xanthoceras sorbifolium]